jgi:hypothetical protein
LPAIAAERTLRLVLVIVRALDPELKIPAPGTDGKIHFVKAPMIGRLVRCPDSLADRAGDRCARLSKNFLGDGVAIAIRLDPPADFMNGLWVTETTLEELEPKWKELL